MKNTLFVCLLFFGFHLQVSAQKWTQLFNGKDLSGWKHVGGGSRFVENGLLSSTGGMG